ncbi:hypothetical protein [Pseudanabaena sp. SR411]|uniref:hypothetical protein n=1 Tax=Pseudanabaena sp. SR411 TaxID=1980935 RepID=UPI0015954AA5|nr:hypothetical protein [Pseudanabaena sp. SR411]
MECAFLAIFVEKLAIAIFPILAIFGFQSLILPRPLLRNIRHCQITQLESNRFAAPLLS